MSWIKTDQPRQAPAEPSTVVRPDSNTLKHSDNVLTTDGTQQLPSDSVTLTSHSNRTQVTAQAAVMPRPSTTPPFASKSHAAIASHPTDANKVFSATGSHFTGSNVAAVTVPSSWRAPLLNAGHWQAVGVATADLATAGLSTATNINPAGRPALSQPPHLTMAVFQSAGAVQLFLQQQHDAALQVILQLKSRRDDSTCWQWQAPPSTDIPALLRQLSTVTSGSAPQQLWLRSWLQYVSQASPSSQSNSTSQSNLLSQTDGASPSRLATASSNLQPTARTVVMAPDAGDENTAAHSPRRGSSPAQRAESSLNALSNGSAAARQMPHQGSNALPVADATPLQRLAQHIQTALQQRWQKTTPPLAMTVGSVPSIPNDASSSTMHLNSRPTSTEGTFKRISRADLQPYWQFLAHASTPQTLSPNAAELVQLLQSHQEHALKSPLALLLLGAHMSPSARPSALPTMASLSQAIAPHVTSTTLAVSGSPLQSQAPHGTATGLATRVLAEHMRADPAIEPQLSNTTQAQVAPPTAQGSAAQRQQLLDFIKQQLLDSMRFQPMLSHDALLSTSASAALAANIGTMLRMLLGRSAPSAVASAATTATHSVSHGKAPHPQSPSGSSHTTSASEIQPLKEKLAAMDKQELSSVLRQLAKLSGAIQISQLNHAEHAIQHAEQKTAPASWHLTLPLAVAPEPCSVRISIQEQLAQQAQQSTQRRWQLKLNFDLASHGQMLALLTLQDVELDLQLYCDSIALRQQVLTLLPTLSARLHQQGLWLVDVQCHLGKLPNTHCPKPATSFDSNV